MSKELEDALKAMAYINGLDKTAEAKLLDDVNKYIGIWFDKHFDAQYKDD